MHIKLNMPHLMSVYEISFHRVITNIISINNPAKVLFGYKYMYIYNQMDYFHFQWPMDYYLVSY